jgi:hypothetical protein
MVFHPALFFGVGGESRKETSEKNPLLSHKSLFIIIMTIFLQQTSESIPLRITKPIEEKTRR